MSAPAPAQTPYAVRDALRSREPAARQAFRAWAAGVVGRVLTAEEAADPRLRDYLSAVAEIAFATSPGLAPAPADGWEAAGFALAVHLRNVLDAPAPPDTSPPGGRTRDPGCRCFKVESWFHPYTPTPGENGVFSGDWFGTHRPSDESLWVAVADVTGHGFESHLLAAGFADLWAYLWEAGPPTADGPLGALCWLDDQLAACLPDSLYVEASVARFAPNGAAELGAPQKRVVVRRRNGAGWEVTRTDVPSPWLGLGWYAARPDCVVTVRLGAGDEVLIGTDGLFDMLGAAGVEELRARAAGQPLAAVVPALIPVALNNDRVRDDLTAVVTRYLGT